MISHKKFSLLNKEKWISSNTPINEDLWWVIDEEALNVINTQKANKQINSKIYYSSNKKNTLNRVKIFQSRNWTGADFYQPIRLSNSSKNSIKLNSLYIYCIFSQT